MKKVFSFVLTVTMLMSLFSIPASAITIPKQEADNAYQAQSFTVVTDGYVENYYINENREVFVNGKNITTITQKSNLSLGIFSAREDWQYAGEFTYDYDLTGLTVAGAVKLLGKLGLKTTVSALKAYGGGYISNSVFQQGVGVNDVQATYYKNINKPRPDMKIEHSFYFYVEVFGERPVEEYLGGFTTYS